MARVDTLVTIPEGVHDVNLAALGVDKTTGQPLYRWAALVVHGSATFVLRVRSNVGTEDTRGVGSIVDPERGTGAYREGGIRLALLDAVIRWRATPEGSEVWADFARESGHSATPAAGGKRKKA